MEKDKVYTISEISKMFNLPVSTLRYYEDENNSIDDIITLLECQKKSVEDKLKELNADYEHVRKKIHFYTGTSIYGTEKIYKASDL